MAFKAALAAAVYENIWPLLEARKTVPPVDSVFPLARAADAHARMADDGRIGRVVLTVGG